MPHINGLPHEEPDTNLGGVSLGDSAKGSTGVLPFSSPTNGTELPDVQPLLPEDIQEQFAALPAPDFSGLEAPDLSGITLPGVEPGRFFSGITPDLEAIRQFESTTGRSVSPDVIQGITSEQIGQAADKALFAEGLKQQREVDIANLGLAKEQVLANFGLQKGKLELSGADLAARTLSAKLSAELGSIDSFFLNFADQPVDPILFGDIQFEADSLQVDFDAATRNFNDGIITKNDYLAIIAELNARGKKVQNEGENTDDFEFEEGTNLTFSPPGEDAETTTDTETTPVSPDKDITASQTLDEGVNPFGASTTQLNDAKNMNQNSFNSKKNFEQIEINRFRFGMGLPPLTMSGHDTFDERSGQTFPGQLGPQT
jgi:hypothetical protein